MNDIPMTDPVTTPRFEQLWQTVGLDPLLICLAAGTGLMLSFYLPRRGVVGLVLLACLSTVLVLPETFAPDFRNGLLNEPGANQASDMRMYVKTFYLMQRNGGHYYEAFAEAYKIRFGRSFGHDTAGFTPPLVNVLWWLTCNSLRQVYLMFQLQLLVGLAAVYGLARQLTRDSLAATVAPALWACYWANVLVAPWWVMAEFWALPWAAVAWLLMLNRRHLPASLLMAAAAFARAHFGLLFPAALAYCWLSGQRRACLTWVMSGSLGLLALALHYRHVSAVYAGASTEAVGDWRLQGGPLHLWFCCLFNWNFLPHVQWLLPFLLLLAGIGLWRLRRRRPVLLWLLLCLAPLSMLLRVGYDRQFNYGAPYFPWMVLLVAVALSAAPGKRAVLVDGQKQLQGVDDSQIQQLP